MSRSAHTGRVFLIGLLLLAPVPAIAHGEQVMAYRLSALIAVGFGMWGVTRLVRLLWERIVACAVLLMTIWMSWGYISPESRSLYEYFLLWTALLAAIPIAAASGTAILLRFFRMRSSRPRS